MKNLRSEKEIETAIRTRHPVDWALYKNVNSLLYSKYGDPIKAGLGDGSPDLVGYVPILGIPVFTAIEVKSATGTFRPGQREWLDRVIGAGGIAMMARDERECFENVERQRMVIEKRIIEKIIRKR